MDINDFKNLKKTLIFAAVVCVIVVLSVFYIQIYGQNKIAVGCSYLDPIAIDLLAFFAALFLIIEGFVKIFEHSGDSIKRQLTRIMRITCGCAILALHVMQFIHK